MTELMPSLCNDCIARNQCGTDDVKMCISYTKETKIKCDDCKFVENCVDYGWEGCRKFTQKPNEPQTNEEWFCSLSTEEKAEFLNLIIRVGPYENEPKDFWECVYGRGGDRGTKSIVEWLKQPHNSSK